MSSINNPILAVGGGNESLEETLILGDTTGASSGIFFSAGNGANFASSSPIIFSSTTSPQGPVAGQIRAASQAVTDGVATRFLDMIVTDGRIFGGVMHYSIHAKDVGGELQVLNGSADVGIVNKGGVLTGAVVKTETSAILTAGTLTSAFSLNLADSTVELSVNANTSLTPTLLEIRWQFHSLSPELVIAA